jgi:hypothetical protein
MAMGTTEMAALAARFVNSTVRHVFLTGKAGTGKTTFLRQLAQSTHKRHIILAPTGIAALNAGGVTIHSQFLLPFGTYVPERRLPPEVPPYGNFHDRDTLAARHPLNAVRRNVLRDVDLLIIDEVSMLRADLLDAIDFRMRSVRQRWDLSFGGAQVLMIGDLFQLPPVVKDEEWHVLSRWYRSAHFFEARVLQEAGYAHIELDKIFRQRDDRFIRILNNLREDRVTAVDVEELNRHFDPRSDQRVEEGLITLTTHNSKADELNQRALAALPGKEFRYQAEVEGEFPENMFPVLRTLVLKEGAQVMFVRNDPEKAYFNGRLARVEKISADDVEVRMLDTGMAYTMQRVVWENSRYVVHPVTREQREEVLGTFEQYPVKLAWAITVHKSQGLTFDRAIIDVGQAFAPGQVYVALSRLRSLDGLILRTRIDPAVVSNDRDVVAFTERRHGQQPLDQQLREQQLNYLRMLLFSTFDLGDLQRALEQIKKEHPDLETFEDEGMRTAVDRQLGLIATEMVIAQRFQGQMARLLQEGDTEALLDRVGRAADYFTAFLRERMKDVLRHLAQVEAFSRTKQYAEALREIDGMLVRKLLTMARAVHVGRCILQGTDVTRQPQVEQDLSAQRSALVAEIAAWAATNMPAASTRSGRRKRRNAAEEQEGDVPHKKQKKAKKVKGETYTRTYALLAEGMDVDAIARERSLSRSTIEGHVARGIGEGVVEIDAVMPEQEREAIAGWMREHPELAMNDARAHFGDTYSYGRLRMVKSWLERAE